MPYDGLVVAATAAELNGLLAGASISKISQPAPRELILTFKVNRQSLRLVLNANPSMPSVYTVEDSVQAPAAAPAFCMALRKHIGGGRIIRIIQPSSEIFTAGLERILIFEIEHLNELGDVGRVWLSVELMGRHSNIILFDGRQTVIDSICHINAATSSVREVLPGRPYFIPETARKINPLALTAGDEEEFRSSVLSKNTTVTKAVYTGVTGISPLIASELAVRAGIDPDSPVCELGIEACSALLREIIELAERVRKGELNPVIVYNRDVPEEFSAIELHSLEGGDYVQRSFDSVMEIIRIFYSEKNSRGRIKAKSEDIRRILKTLTERTSRKLDLQEKLLADTDRMDEFRVKGELINVYGYGLAEGAERLVCSNYYDGDKEITIPLDRNLSAKDNARRYFDKYTKLKRTKEALIPQIKEGRDRLYHLDSIAASLELAENEQDLNILRKELADFGFIRKQPYAGRRRQEQGSVPLHFVSSDGIDIYVGRNNYQNEEITFKLAAPEDYWFHAKKIPGSHVIAKTGNAELPDRTCLEAAALAAWYSAAGHSENVSGQKIEVDYVRRRYLKKVPGAQPGYVIYHTNYSIMIEPKKDI